MTPLWVTMTVMALQAAAGYYDYSHNTVTGGILDNQIPTLGAHLEACYIIKDVQFNWGKKKMKLDLFFFAW